MRSVIRSLFLLCAVLVLPVTSSAADSRTPPPLPQAVEGAVEGGTLNLLGYGRMRKWIWDAFDVSLWITGDTWSWNEPFVLELRYVRSFDGEEIVEGTRNQWEHLGYTNEAQLELWLKQLIGIFPNVKVGDQLAGVYLPGRETHFFHNGQPIGTMSDPAFGPAFFAIWLDPKSSESTLREELLGSRCAKPSTIARAEVKSCGGATMPTPSTQRPGAARP